MSHSAAPIYATVNVGYDKYYWSRVTLTGI